MSYRDFLDRKRRVWTGSGVDAHSLPSQLYPWQAKLVTWALRKGRAALFADCGLGKTFMQLAWAHELGVPTLILAPLCVAEQTVAEGARLGIPVRYCCEQSEIEHGSLGPQGITITNYERLAKFEPSAFGAVVLDESSILKAFDGKTRTRLIEAFADTPYRLCCTATPSPNDIAELANHAEFLGLMTRPEFLATWFVHDDQGWRMKRHAVGPFFRWLASWAMAIRCPSDIGGDDDGFALPPLRIHDEVVESPGVVAGAGLFPELGMKGIQGRSEVRRASLPQRLERLCALTDDGESWIVWCGMNAESDAATKAIDGAMNVQGGDGYAEKVGAVKAFVAGDIRVLVSKAKILGFGMNFQHCSRMAFMGLGDSYESYYQCIRRSWRFGQTRPVDAHVIVSEPERLIVQNVRRKEAAADELSRSLLEHVRDFEREELVA